MSDQRNFTAKTLLFSMLGGAIVVLVCCLLWWKQPHPLPPPDQDGPSMRFDTRYVKESDLLTTRNDFKKTNFMRNSAAGPVALDSVAVMMDETELTKVLDSLQEVYEEPLAITFRHGLRVVSGSYQYYPLITFAVIDEQPPGSEYWDVEPIVGAGSKFALDVNGRLSPSLGAAWVADTVYANQIRIWSTGTTGSGPKYDPFDRGMDVETYSLMVKELELLISSNGGSTEYVKALSISEALDDDKGYAWHMRHHVCLVTTAGAGDQYKENVSSSGATPTHAPYKDRAMDVGSPCPPRCRKAHFPVRGVPVRKEPWP